jgi:hypothetical protein
MNIYFINKYYTMVRSVSRKKRIKCKLKGGQNPTLIKPGDAQDQTDINKYGGITQ